MKLDRALQREILEFLADHYAGDRQDVFPQRELTAEEDDKYTTNLLYLEAHGLVDSGLEKGVDGHWSSAGARITARGLDFLADDGGLTAILGTVTVRFHDDTIRELIAMRIEQSGLPADEKTGLLNQLKALRGESIKHLTMKLLDTGLEHAPKALPVIQNFLETLAR
ncbi:hypothetical protein [Massilia sp. LjRoot122]|uniref:hypothetical protein n=1 Tax=Massilia sp. LjRoot122 TaxID=3342257 RepID=UPI003ED14288